MRRYSSPTEDELREIIARPLFDRMSVAARVGEIFSAVKDRGDAALIEYAHTLDGAVLDSIWVRGDEFEAAEAALPRELKEAIRTAHGNIETFHRSQREAVAVVETTPGVRCWRKSLPISPIGIYIPGGTAPLFSTALMLGVPARLAGCGEIVVCTPPDRQGRIHPAILFSLALSGITRVVKAGGAQAIAALGFGTETIPAVAKIFGPGNQYVTAAKQEIMQHGVAIDLPAGPSEVAILADTSARADFIAADLLSQAEHGADSQTLLVTTSTELIIAVEAELSRQLEMLPRRELAARALEHSAAVSVASLEDGMKLINRYAPEHLIIITKDAEAQADLVRNAGSVFIGEYTPESAGDYASGTNHTLPTNGYARQSGGVSLDSFIKKVTFQQITRAGLLALSPAICTMAEAEGLSAHARAVSIRLKGDA